MGKIDANLIELAVMDRSNVPNFLKILPSAGKGLAIRS
jgi:hypothetical protein